MQHQKMLRGPIVVSSRVEGLEEKFLLAAGPGLVSVTPNVGLLYNPDGSSIRNEAPRELTFQFSPGHSIDTTTLGGIQVYRSGNDGGFNFSYASVTDAFGTSGGNAASIQVTANRMGSEGNQIQLHIATGAIGIATPTIIRVGDDIFVTLNNSGPQTTANDFVTALNSDSASKGLVTATLLSNPTTTGNTVLGVPAGGVLNLTGANDTSQVLMSAGYVDQLSSLEPNKVIYRFAETLPDDRYRVEVHGDDVRAHKLHDFGTLGGVTVGFEAVATGTSGNGVAINFLTNPAVGGAPTISTNLATRTVTVTFNTLGGNTTSANTLVAALSANSLLRATVAAGDGTRNIAIAASLSLTNASASPGLKNTSGDFFSDGGDAQLNFQLDLGPQVVSVVPQPVLRDKNVTLLSNPTTGQTLTIAVGDFTKTFEFTNGVPSGTNVSVAIGVDAATTAGNLRTAINGSSIGGAANIFGVFASGAANIVTVSGNAYQPMTSKLASALSLSEGGIQQKTKLVNVYFNDDDFSLVRSQNVNMFDVTQLADGNQVVVTGGSGSRTFEFDANNSFGGNVQVSFNWAQSSVTVAATLAAAINNSNIGAADSAGVIASAVGSRVIVTGKTVAATVTTTAVAAAATVNPAGIVTDPAFYQLVDTKGTTTTSDDTILIPTSVSYNAGTPGVATTTSDAATLVFTNDLPQGTYKLRVGTSQELDSSLAQAVQLGRLFSVAGGTSFSTNAIFGDSANGTADTADLYRFDVASNGTLTITLNQNSTFNGTIELLASDGTTAVSPTHFTSSSYSDTGILTTETFTANGLVANNAANPYYYVRITSNGATTGSYQLSINTTAAVSASDTNTSYGDATPLGELGVGGKTISASIQAQTFGIPQTPGSVDEPGNRDVPVYASAHLDDPFITVPDTGVSLVANTTVLTQAYNFKDVYGFDGQGNPLHNQITENQKQRAREIFELFGRITGKVFVETASSGIMVVTGDASAVDNTNPPGVSLGSPGAFAIMDNSAGSLILYGNSDYGGAWQDLAFHEIGHALGLGHTWWYPAFMGGTAGQPGSAGLSGNSIEGVFPSDNDIVNIQRISPPFATDIDLYEFTLTEDGDFTAEITAERQTPTSQLDSVLTVFRDPFATVTSDLGSTNAAQLRFTAFNPGEAGNDIRVIVTASANGNGSPLVTVSGHDVLVDLDTGASAVNSSANAIIAALSANTLIRGTLVSATATGTVDLRPGVTLQGSVTASLSGGNREVVARNDDYYSNDSYINLRLTAGKYYVGVTSKGNDSYDPSIQDSGYGGRTQGAYKLQLGFSPIAHSSLIDAENSAATPNNPTLAPTALDGDADGVPGGVFEFTFQVGSTIFVDKDTTSSQSASSNLGNVLNPTDDIATALAKAASRIVVPAAGASAIADGEIFKINDGVNPTVFFEFDKDAVATSIAGANSPTIRIALSAADDAQTVANKIRDAINGAGGNPVDFNGIVHVLNTAATTTNDSLLNYRVDLTSVTTLDVSDSQALLTAPNLVRIVGNNSNKAYLLGYGNSGIIAPLNNGTTQDGSTFAVPQGTTVMVDAGAILKLQTVVIEVGSAAGAVNRQDGAFQVLGTPTNRVTFTSLRDDSIGGDSDGASAGPDRGQWGGIVFRHNSDMNDSDLTDNDNGNFFLNSVYQANMSYGGGQVTVNSVTSFYTTIYVEDERPTVAYNTIQNATGYAISADPNSFDDSLSRIGPDIHGNRVVNNSGNGVLVRIATSAGVPIDKLTRTARFDDSDIPYVLTQNLLINGNVGGSQRVNEVQQLSMVGAPSSGTFTLSFNPGGVAATTLSQDVLTSTQTTIPVTSAAVYSTLKNNGQLPVSIMVDLEQMTVTDVTGTNLTVIRGVNGTTATTHLQNARVSPVTTTDPIAFNASAATIQAELQKLTTIGFGGVKVTGGLLLQDPLTVEFIGQVRGSTNQPKIVAANVQSHVGIVDPSQIAEATTVTITSSAGTGIFEFDSDSSFTFTNIQVSFTTAQSASTVATSLANAINTSAIGVAANGVTATVVGSRVVVIGKTAAATVSTTAPAAAITVSNPSLVGAAVIVKDSTDTPLLANGGVDTARPGGRLTIDPGVIVKLGGSRIEGERGSSQLIAEGAAGQQVIFTSINDDRFGGSGSFDTTNNGFGASAQAHPGDWGGLDFYANSRISLDRAYIAFGGGSTPIEGSFDRFNVIEVVQADLRLTNSVLDQNASGLASGTRNARGSNAQAIVFVRGAQPVIVNNLFQNNNQDYNSATGVTTTNQANVISINANALNFTTVPDWGRSTGGLADDPGDLTPNLYNEFSTNHGALVRLNRLQNNGTNGMEVRGEELTTETVWDDTDIVHVLRTPITILNQHTYGGLRLQSASDASLVVKLSGANAGFRADGIPLDIDDRIGGTLQIIGTPGFPVVLTALADDSVGASLNATGFPDNDTNNNGFSTGTPGAWGSITIDRWANDRNVAVVNELEKPLTGGVDVNVTTPQQLGDLAPSSKSSTENRRAGFEVHGTISPDDPTDIDVYSFTADGGTEIWLDIDRVNPALDTIVELIDGAGVVLAQSQSNSSLVSTPTVQALDIQKNSLLGPDYYATTQRDAGMRVVLPGTPGVLGTFRVRVRSNPGATGVNDLQGGLTSGEYQLQIRLQQRDEKPGSTIKFADIRYATNGIQVIGHPAHSTLSGETTEVTGDNNGRAGGQQLGNLLTTDRNTISVGGALSDSLDVDFYQFTLNYRLTEEDALGNLAPAPVAVTFDLDYANGMPGPDTTMAIFDSSGRLIFVSRESNIFDDQSTNFQDLLAGSVGKLDPFIGTVSLTDQTSYFLAVVSNERLPTALNAQFVSGSTTATSVRLEPVNSIRRIAEDHIGFQGYSTNNATPGLPGPVVAPVGSIVDGVASQPLLNISTVATLQTAVQSFTLADVVLFVSGTNSLSTFNPLLGTSVTTVNGNLGGQGLTSGNTQDIVMRSDGILYGYQNGNNNPAVVNAGRVGQLVTFDSTTGMTTISAAVSDNINDSSTQTTSQDPNSPLAGGNDFDDMTVSNLVEAVAMERTGSTGGSTNNPAQVNPNYTAWYGVHEDGTTAARFVTIVDPSQIVDTDTVTINSAAGNGIFEFDNNGSFTNIQVSYTTAQSPSTVATNLAAAINASAIGVAANGVTASVANSRVVVTGKTGIATANTTSSPVAITVAVNPNTVNSKLYRSTMTSGATTGGAIANGGNDGGFGDIQYAGVNFASGTASVTDSGSPQGTTTIHFQSRAPGAQGNNINLFLSSSGVNNGTITVTSNSTSVSVTAGQAATAQAIVDAINNNPQTLITASVANGNTLGRSIGTTTGFFSSGTTGPTGQDDATVYTVSGSHPHLLGNVTGLAFNTATPNNSPLNSLYGVTSAGELISIDRFSTSLQATATLIADFNLDTNLQDAVSLALTGATGGPRITGFTSLALGPQNLQGGVFQNTLFAIATTSGGNNALVAFRIVGAGLGSFGENNELEFVNAFNDAVAASPTFGDNDNEIWTLDFSVAPANNDTFNITFRDPIYGVQTTAAISYDTTNPTGATTATRILTALNNLIRINPGDVTVTALSATQFKIRFESTGFYGEKDVNPTSATFTTNVLTGGGAASIAQTAIGGDGLRETFLVQNGNLNNATGLAFSTLDFNLWHPTQRRASDAGHGINSTSNIDSSRNPGSETRTVAAPSGTTQSESNGGVSFYFGLELAGTNFERYPGSNNQQLGFGNNTLQTDMTRTYTGITANPNTTNAGYNLPGGAYGKLVTAPIDLSTYNVDDKPALYFNYFLQTEDASSNNNNNAMRDSARVYASRDGGRTWLLVATNNSTLSSGATPADKTLPSAGELPALLSNSSTIATTLAGMGAIPTPMEVQQVQLLHDSTGSPQVWRQARVDLSAFAGFGDVRFRFDFATAGHINDSTATVNGTPTDQWGDFNSAAKGQNNQFEGFYIDDIIVGITERGEMVTNAPVDSTFYDLYSDPNTRLTNLTLPNRPSENLSGTYQVEIRRGTEYQDLGQNILSQNTTIRDATVEGRDSNNRYILEPISAVSNSTQSIGDRNIERQQGQIILDGNIVRSFSGTGILIDAGTRGTQLPNNVNSLEPHAGSVINTPSPNTSRLVPGVVVMNNIVADIPQSGIGILFDGDTNPAANPLAPVPFGKILNNTIYGAVGAQRGVGIAVGVNVSPTLLNNVVVNTATSITVDPTSASTIIGTTLFQNNGANANVGSNGTLAPNGVTLFIDPATFNFYPAPSQPGNPNLLIDSGVSSLIDRIGFMNVKTPLGLPQSDILLPKYDLYGQVRNDDGNTPDATGLGEIPFIDRGAVERIDINGPTAALVIPLDNGPDDLDKVASAPYGNPPNGVLYNAIVDYPLGGNQLLTEFQIALSDVGIGINNAAINAAAFIKDVNGTLLNHNRLVTITKNGVPFEDYQLAYNANTKRIIITSLTTFDSDSVYTITLNRGQENERQRLGIDGIPTSGTFQLVFDQPGASAVLSGAINTLNPTAVTVNPNTLIGTFPLSPTAFTIRVDDELMTATFNAGTNTLNITARGINGTTASTHQSNIDVFEVVSTSTTAAIPFNATATDITNALVNTLTDGVTTGGFINADELNITGGALAVTGTYVDLEFTGPTTASRYYHAAIPQLRVANSTFTPATSSAQVATLVDGNLFANPNNTLPGGVRDLAGLQLQPNQPTTGNTQFTITVLNGKNDDPLIGTPGTLQRTNEDTPLIFSTAFGNALTISDQDAFLVNGDMQVNLTAIGGTLTLTNTTGLDFTYVDITYGNGDPDGSDGTLAFRGTLSEINQALQGLTYTPLLNRVNRTGNGSAATAPDDDMHLQIDVNDLGQFYLLSNGTIAAPATATTTMDFQVDPVNDAPVFTVAIPTINTEDEDANSGGTVTVNGVLSNIEIAADPVTADDEGSIVTGENQTVSFTVTPATGMNARYNALFDVANGGSPAIDSSGNLTFKLNPDANSASIGGPVTLDVVAIDSGSGVAPNINQSAAQQIVIDIQAVNDAPTIGALLVDHHDVSEDAGAQGAGGSIHIVNPATFSPGGGSDEASQTLAGFVVTVSSVNGGSPWNTGNFFSVAPVVDINGNLTYTVAQDVNGSATLSIQAQDSGSGTPPDVNLSAALTFTVNVSAINDQPILTLPTFDTQAGIGIRAGTDAPDPFAMTAMGPATALDEIAGQSVATNGYTLTTPSVLYSSNPGTPLTFTGPVSINDAGQLSYTSAGGNGIAVITATVMDNGSGTAPNVNTSDPVDFYIAVGVTPPQVYPVGADNITLIVNDGSSGNSSAGDVEIYQTAVGGGLGTFLTFYTMVSLNNGLLLQGNSNANEVTFDYTNGAPIPAGVGVILSGGLGIDSIQLINSVSITSIDDTFANANQGVITIDDGSARTINYIQVEGGITDTLLATTRTFHFADTADNISLDDFGTTIDFLSQISSTSSSNTVVFRADASTNVQIFADATASGSSDTINLLGFDAVSASNITVNGGAGSDKLVGQTSLANTFQVTGQDSGTASIDTSNFDYTVTFNLLESLQGGSAADTFKFDNGTFGLSGTIDGQGGNDTLDYSAYLNSVGTDGGSVTVTLSAAGTGLATHTAGELSIETVIGGAGDDVLTASATVAVRFEGRGGVDLMTGSTLNDTMFGEDGNDTLVGGSGNDSLLGGADDDSLVDGMGDDVLVGGDGSDTYVLTPGSTDSVDETGTTGTDVLDFSNVALAALNAITINMDSTTQQTIDGNGNKLTLVGGTFENFIGSPNNDSVTINSQTVIRNINGGGGTDTLTAPNLANFWTIDSADHGSIQETSFLGTAFVQYFVSIENLVGGTLDDAFRFLNGATISSTVNGTSGVDSISFASYTTAVTVTLTGASANGFSGTTSATNPDPNPIGTGFSNIDSVTGSGASDTLIGQDIANVWTISAPAAGDVTNANGTFNFSSFETVQGRSFADTLKLTLAGPRNVILSGTPTANGFSGSSTAINFTGMDSIAGTASPSDTLTGADRDATWNVDSTLGTNRYTDVGTGRVLNYSSFENLTGGSKKDTFVLANNIGVSGKIDGGANDPGTADTINYAAYLAVNPVTIDLSNKSATKIFGGAANGFSNIESVIGGQGNDKIIGDNIANVWTLTAANTGNVNGFAFSSFETLQGGTGAAGDELIGPNLVNDWNITTPKAGTIKTGATTITNFSQMETLTGGSQADNFVFATGATVDAVNGKGGADSLDLSAAGSPRSVKLTADTAEGFTGTDQTLAVDRVVTNGFTGIDSITAPSAVGDRIQGISGTPARWILGPTKQYIDVSTGRALTFVSFEIIDVDPASTSPNEFVISGTQTFDLTGGAGPDTFTFNPSAVLIGSINGLDGNDTVNLGPTFASQDFKLSNLGTTDGYQGSVTTGTTPVVQVITGGFDNIDSLVGGGGFDSLTGIDGFGATWAVGPGTARSYTRTGGPALGFSSIENLNGGNQVDIFNVTGTQNVNLSGGAGNDEFNFADGASITGSLVGGADNDTVSFAGNLIPATIGGVIGSVNLNNLTSIETVIGGDGSDTLIGLTAGTIFTVNNLDSGTAGTIVFQGFENLTGSSGNDSFNFTLGGRIRGSIDGGLGTDSLSFAASTNGSVTISLTNLGSSDGYQGTSSHSIGSALPPGTAHFQNINTVTGTTGASNQINGIDTLTGELATWKINGTGATPSQSYTVRGRLLNFSEFETMTGGSGNDEFTITGAQKGNLIGGPGIGKDSFKFSAGATLNGYVDGGAGNDHLGFEAYTTAVTATLTQNQADGFWGDVKLTSDSSNITSFRNIDTLFGGTKSDTLNGISTQTAAWQFDGTNRYSNPGPAIDESDYLVFDRFENLGGGDQADVFRITGAPQTVNLNGNGGDDQFIIVGNSGVNGTIDGGGNFDTLDLSAKPAGQTINAGSLLNIENVIGTSGADTVLGPNGGATFIIEAGQVTVQTLTSSVTFFNVENLQGGTGSDIFQFEDGGSISGTLNGGTGAGIDTLDFGNTTTFQTFVLTNLGSNNGFAGTTSAVGGNFDNINALIGSTSTDDSVQGRNATSTWTSAAGDTVDYVSSSRSINLDGIEILQGGNQVDTFNLSGAPVVHTVRGGDGNDVISAAGMTIAVALYGENGNDILSGGDDFDLLDGGAGIDEVRQIANANQVLTDTDLEDVGLGTIDSLVDIERANLTAGAAGHEIDAILATIAVTLNGGNGNDTLYGGSGDDSINGGGGSDELYGFAGRDTVDGGAGDDDSVSGGEGDDSLVGGSGGGDALYEVDGLFGTVILKTASMSSSLGTDTLSGFEGASLIGSDGVDNVLDASGFSGNATLQGGDGNDVLIGGSGNDSLDGGVGNDTLTGGLGDDEIDGGIGTDVFLETANVNLTLTNGALAGVGSDLFTNIALVMLIGGSGNNKFTATGFSGNVSLDGGSGNDTLLGGSGNNTLTGGLGNDSLDGGTGFSILVETANASLTLTNTKLTGVGTDTLKNIDAAFLTGGSSNNKLTASGFSGPVTLDGSGGNDTLIGGSGADDLRGGEGNDQLTGGAGSDRLDGGNGTDTLIETGIANATFNPGGSTLLIGADTDVLVVVGVRTIENVSVTTGSSHSKVDFRGWSTGNVTLTGGNGNDTLWGGDGDDSIKGQKGNDFLFGEDGYDTIDGGDGNDVIDTGDAPGPGTLSKRDSALGGNGNDTIRGGSGNDLLNGGAGNDILLGGNGNDSLLGGSGNDVLRGQEGNDTLSGQSGSDKLDFGNPGEGSGDKRISSSSDTAGDYSGIFSDDDFNDLIAGL